MEKAKRMTRSLGKMLNGQNGRGRKSLGEENGWEDSA